MNKSVIENKLQEIEALIKRKQFIVAEQKSKDIIKNLDTSKYYEYYIQACLYLSDALVKNIKNLKALEELEKVLETYPYEEKILLFVYELSFKLKRFARAESALKTIVNTNPEDIESRFKLISLYIDKADYLEAIRELNILLEMNLQSIDIYKMLAVCYEKSEMYIQSIEAIKNIQKISDDVEFFIYEVQLLIKNKELSKAYSLIMSIINYKLDSERFDESIITIINFFINIFISLSYRDEFVALLFEIGAKYQKTITLQAKIKIEKLLKDLNLELVNHYIFKYNNPANFSAMDNKHLIDNLALLIQNEDKLENNSLSDFIKKNDLFKSLPKEYKPFFQTLVI